MLDPPSALTKRACEAPAPALKLARPIRIVGDDLDRFFRPLGSARDFEAGPHHSQSSIT
jgi:hypothetical protein